MIDRIQPQDLYNRISVDHNLHVIDARDQDLYALVHIPGALNNPHQRLQTAPNFVPDDHPVILYDANDGGADSDIEKTGLLLQERGFQVQILEGGMLAWTEAGLPTESEQ